MNLAVRVRVAQCFTRSTLGETWRGMRKGVCAENKDWEDWNVGERLQTNMKRIKWSCMPESFWGTVFCFFFFSFPWTTTCIKDEYYTTIVSPFVTYQQHCQTRNCLVIFILGLGGNHWDFLLLVLFPLYSTDLGRESTWKANYISKIQPHMSQPWGTFDWRGWGARRKKSRLQSKTLM